jgi:hypothetical protein
MGRKRLTRAHDVSGGSGTEFPVDQLVLNCPEGGVMRSVRILLASFVFLSLLPCDTAAKAPATGVSRIQHLCDSLRLEYLSDFPEKSLSGAFMREAVTRTLLKWGADHKRNWLPDTVVVQSKWGGMSRSVYSYNAIGLVTLAVQQAMSGEEDRRETYTYDVNGLLLLCEETIGESHTLVHRITQAFSPQNKPVTMKMQGWNQWTGELLYEVDHSFVYDGKGRSILESGEYRDGGILSSWWRYSQGYDRWDNETASTLENWSLERGEDGWRWSGAIDSIGRYVSSINERKTDGAWRFQDRSDFSYGTGGSPDSVFMRVWEDGTWVNSRLDVCHSEKDLEIWVDKRWSDCDWILDGRSLSSFDESGRIYETVMQEAVEDAWRTTLHAKTTYSFSGIAMASADSAWENGVLQWCGGGTRDEDDNILTEYDETWEGGSLKSGSRATYTYVGSSADLSIVTNEGWIDGQWVRDSRKLFGYDVSGRLIHLQFQAWRSGAWVSADSSALGRASNWQFEDRAARFFRFAGYSDLFFRYRDRPTADVKKSGAVPSRSELLQNYPNPFNPSSRISYAVGQPSVVSLVKVAVYDLLGREVAVLVEERKEPGSYEARFNGGGLPSGVYIYRLTVGDFSQSRKMVLVR